MPQLDVAVFATEIYVIFGGIFYCFFICVLALMMVALTSILVRRYLAQFALTSFLRLSQREFCFFCLRAYYSRFFYVYNVVLMLVNLKK
jgi:hypothetical protein